MNTRVPSSETLRSSAEALIWGRQAPGWPVVVRTLTVDGTVTLVAVPPVTRLNRPAA